MSEINFVSKTGYERLALKYNAQGGYKRKRVKVIYARWYICQCKRKKITKKQEAAKEAALKRNERGTGHTKQQ